MQTTIEEFSRIAIEAGLPDLFDFAVDRDILDIDEMKGSLADARGDKIVEFKIIKIGTDTDSYGDLTHLDTIIEVANGL